MNEEAYRKLKTEVEEKTAEADRARGALDLLMKRLKDEFECDSIKEGKKALKELTERREKAEVAFDKAVKSYEAKWKGDDAKEE